MKVLRENDPGKIDIENLFKKKISKDLPKEMNFIKKIYNTIFLIKSLLDFYVKY